MDPSIPDPSLFLQYDFPQTRDLLKSFLTLVSAVLVLSVTFSEKITKTHDADVNVRRLMFASWVFFFLAIIFGGTGILFIAGAAGCAIYGYIPIVACGGWSLAIAAWSVGVMGGVSFSLGLICIMLAARRAILLDGSVT